MSIYLVEGIKEGDEKPRLGTEGKEIHENKYKSFESLEKYCIKRMLKKYPRIFVSVYYADNIYGEPHSMWEYSRCENYRGYSVNRIYPENEN